MKVSASVRLRLRIHAELVARGQPCCVNTVAKLYLPDPRPVAVFLRLIAVALGSNQRPGELRIS
jgi:hypothetical protein